jgi:serine/threonine-protein kinase
MLGEYGETLAVDWGLAKVLDRPQSKATVPERPVHAGSGSETALGQVVGTPAFMPPEQAEGRLDQLGPRSDVFALGATLYSLLTGHAPYGGPDALAQAQRGEVVPARQRKRSVPAALEAVCAKAMEKNPDDRYPTARALAEDVQRWLADEPVGAYREPLLERARRWGRRNRTLVVASVVLLVASVVGLSLGLWAVAQEKARTDRALERALDAEEEARTNLTRAEANLKRTYRPPSRPITCRSHGPRRPRRRPRRRRAPEEGGAHYLGGGAVNLAAARVTAAPGSPRLAGECVAPRLNRGRRAG